MAKKHERECYFEGVPPDVQQFFQTAKDICGTMQEGNRTMSIEEWAEVLALSCPGEGCEDPEVFAAMREGGITAFDDDEDQPHFGTTRRRSGSRHGC